MNALITRVSEQCTQTAHIFESRGITPFIKPMLCLEKLRDVSFKYDNYDYCILSSPSAARFFTEIIKDRPLDINNYAVVGEKTAKELLVAIKPKNAIIKPERAYTKELLLLLKARDFNGKRVLLAGAKERIQDITEDLQALGATTDVVDIYENVPIIYPAGEVQRLISDNKINIVTFFSPSAVRAFFTQARLSANIAVVCVGKTTNETLLNYGVTAIIAQEQSAEGVAEAILSYGGAKC
ncbi:uroporphyrinogen-III synthase [Deferribacterales bacterium RsTz2092]|nr:uroporphyrinogen-III synthase [Deferribacterales bacterium]